MSSDAQGRIENSLRDIRYHPDFAAEANDQINQLIAKLQETGQLQSRMQEIRSRMYDVVLMTEKYFPARLEFLSRLVPYLEERPESNLAIAEDGCGTGVDLHVLNALLTDKVTLTGIDSNEASLEIARSRVPKARFVSDFQGDSFHIIYSDFVSIDANFVWEVAERGKKNFNALRSPGVVFQNTDMRQLALYCRYFGQKFSKILHPEFLAAIQDGPDSYLCRFERE